MGPVSELLEKYGVEIRNIQFSKGKDDSRAIRLFVRLPEGTAVGKILEDLRWIEGVTKAYEE